MSTEPNYRKLSPPEDKTPPDYTWAERRAEIYDLIERAGHYRNLERSTRDLGRRYDVSHQTIANDIHIVNEWRAEHLGDDADHELSTLKTRAVQDYLDEGKSAAAYYLMKNHYEILMEAGLKDRAADKHEHELSGSVGWRQYIEHADAESESDS